LRAQLRLLVLELDARELREPAQAQLEDVVGLECREVEDLHEAPTRGLGVVGRADDLDDLVDVEDRDEEAVDEVEALASSVEPVRAAASHDVEPVVDPHLEELLEPERARLPV